MFPKYFIMHAWLCNFYNNETSSFLAVFRSHLLRCNFCLRRHHRPYRFSPFFSPFRSCATFRVLSNLLPSSPSLSLSCLAPLWQLICRNLAIFLRLSHRMRLVKIKGAEPPVRFVISCPFFILLTSDDQGTDVEPLTTL